MLSAVEPPRRSPLSEIHDRERIRRIRGCLRDGQSLLDPEDDALATRQAEWDIRRRNPLRWVLHVGIAVSVVSALSSAIAGDGSLQSVALPIFIAATLALGLFEEWRVRRRARRWLGRPGIYSDPPSLA